MGRSPDLIDQRFDRAREFYEAQLRPLGLSKEEISKQSLDQLQTSLRDINRLIADPSYFSKFQISASVNLTFTSGSKPEVTAEMGPLPLLLERHREIEDRIRQLEAEGRVAAI